MVPRTLLVWLCDEEMKAKAKGDKPMAFARLNMATGEARDGWRGLSFEVIQMLEVMYYQCGRGQKGRLSTPGPIRRV